VVLDAHTCISRFSIDEQLAIPVLYPLPPTMHGVNAYVWQRGMLNTGLSKKASDRLLQVT